ncbi:hypothetical protein [Roseivirga pacifica]
MNWLKNLFKKKKIVPPQRQKIKMEMSNISEAILSHLKMKTSGALLLTGDWGSGKTYHVKKHVFPVIEDQTEFIPIIVSLYGETDKTNIAQKVLFAFFDKKGEDSNLSTGTIAKNIKNFTEAIPAIKKYVDVDKLITGTGDNIFKFLPHDKLLICFDDIERMSSKIDVSDFLGLVNELVENKGCKVLLIANEEEIDKGISFKEKTIEKTIHFHSNISNILEDIVDEYDVEFKSYIIENKDWILKTLNPNIEDESDQKELKKSFSNIRTLKFAIEHFSQPYFLISAEKDLKDELTQKQLKNIWVFILAVSIEFRKPNNISFNERKNIDIQTTSLSDIDFSQLNLMDHTAEDASEETEDQWSYSKKFKKLYFNRLSETYIFHPEIYDLITSGKTIDSSRHIENLEKSFNVVEGKVSPAHELLGNFMHGYWKFSNDEFSDKLNELLVFSEKGELGDLISYLNAGVYLLGFSDLFDKSKEDVVNKLKSGISIFLEKTQLNYAMITQLEMTSGHFNEENLQNIKTFIDESIKLKEIENDKQEAIRLEKLFGEDIKALVKEFLPQHSDIRTPDKPIFHKFDINAVKTAVGNWNAEGIMDFTSLLKIRYLDTGFSERLTDELDFLENLESGISDIDFEQKTISNYTIQNQLVSRVAECKKRLNDHKNALQQTL